MDVINSFRGSYDCFSNFSPAAVSMCGIEFPTVENAFQAAKCADSSEYPKFIGLTATEAKRLGRSVHLRYDWDVVKEWVMLRLLLQKFAPGTQAHTTLSSTKGKWLVEGNRWHDNYWGNCTCDRCVHIVGQNKLGLLLMQIRDMEM